MQDGVRIFVATPFENPEWKWLAPRFDRPRWSMTFRNYDLFSKRAHRWMFAAFDAARQARKYDLLITHAPYMTLYVAWAARMLGVRTPHAAFSFNHGNGRFFSGLRLRMAGQALPGVRCFAVYSRAEIEILSSRYGLDPSRFTFQHWAVGDPEFAERPPLEPPSKPRVCCMGRNNRDFGLFLRAVEGLNVEGVVVCPPGALQGQSVPPNVRVLHNQPVEACNAILRTCVCSVVPVLDSSTGAGHIAMVTAMKAGVPVIVTDLAPVRDYVIGGHNGVRVPPGDAAAVAAAIRSMIERPERGRELAANAKAFAERWLSEDAAARNIVHVLDAVLAGNGGPDGRVPQTPPGWNQFIASAGSVAVNTPNIVEPVGY